MGFQSASANLAKGYVESVQRGTAHESYNHPGIRIPHFIQFIQIFIHSCGILSRKKEKLQLFAVLLVF